MSGLVTAGIWLRIDGFSFPAKGWEDFAVVVLAAWIDAAIRLLQGESREEQVHFMEGPYVVKIEAQATAWRLLLVQRSETGDIERSVTVTPAPLVDSIISASDAVLRICRDRGWESVDSIRLNESIGRLRPLQ